MDHFMKQAMEQFVCTHCGHRFESPSQETLVCPNCFWSTSVKRQAGEVRIGDPPVAAPAASSSSPRTWFWIGVLLSALLLLGVSVFAFRHLQKQDEILRTIETENAKVIAREAPELALLPEEREIINRSIPLGPAVPLAEAEKKILANRLPLRSRLIQGLATPPWDEKQFNTFLKAEEAQYRVPLPRSYRRKLTELFQQHYLPGAAAFEAKDFLTARDEWIRSLAFPVYRNDVQKHRGVVLTMLSPFVNDTLARIGTMNAMLTEKDVYEAEEKIRLAYDALHDLLQKESWEEASAKLLEIEKGLAGMGKPKQAVRPPPLPQEISLIDPDIREVLLAQMAPAQPGVQDWETFRQDLWAKEKVIRSRVPSTLEAIREQYEQALTLIKNGDWKQARSLLQKIEFPEVLAEDARAKVRILNKSLEGETPAEEGPSLDSGVKTS
jgi:hypothetical protein